MILLSRKLVREYKCYQKHCIACTFTIMQTTKNMNFHACACIVCLLYSFAMSTHVCNVLSKDFVKQYRFRCCFWSAQCNETQTRTSDNLKTWVFISLIVQWGSFIDNVVHCNTLRSIKAAFLELEKAMFTGATLVPMFTIITPGPNTHSKQSTTFYARDNLMVNCEKKWAW